MVELGNNKCGLGEKIRTPGVLFLSIFEGKKDEREHINKVNDEKTKNMDDETAYGEITNGRAY